MDTEDMLCNINLAFWDRKSFRNVVYDKHSDEVACNDVLYRCKDTKYIIISMGASELSNNSQSRVLPLSWDQI